MRVPLGGSLYRSPVACQRPVPRVAALTLTDHGALVGEGLAAGLLRLGGIVDMVGYLTLVSGQEWLRYNPLHE